MPRHFTDWLSAYQELTARMEPPSLFKEWTGVFTVAAALERKCWVKWDKLVFPNLYVILVGGSGTRKSSALKMAQQFLGRIGLPGPGDDLTKQAIIAEMEYAQKGVSEFLLKEHNYPCKLMSSIVMVSDELGVLFGFGDEAKVAAFNNWYDCGGALGVFSYKTKNKGSSTIIGPCVNVLAAVPPKSLVRIIPKFQLESGLLARTVWVWGTGKSRLDLLPLWSEEETETAQKLVSDLKDIHEMEGPFIPEESWEVPYMEWYQEFDKRPPFEEEIMQGYVNKRQTLLIKLCQVFSASAGRSFKLTWKEFERAKHLIERTERDMLKVFSGAGRMAAWAEVQDEIMGLVNAKGLVAVAEILRKFKKEGTAKELSEMIEGLVLAGRADRVPGKDGKWWLQQVKEGS